MIITKEKPLDAAKQTEGLLNEVKTPMQNQNNTSAILIKANTNLNQLAEIQHNKIVTHTLILSKKFKRPHKNIMRAVENLRKTDYGDRLNFEPIFYKDSYGRRQKMYSMDRRSFSILVMGFTGKVAMKWKHSFYDAFESMEKVLLQQSVTWQHDRIEGKKYRHDLTDAIQKLERFAELSGSKKAKNYYNLISRMINKTVFGLSKVPKNFRDTLSEDSLKQLQLVEWKIAQWLEKAIDGCSDYHEPYYIIKTKLKSLIEVIGNIKPTPLIAA